MVSPRALALALALAATLGCAVASRLQQRSAAQDYGLRGLSYVPLHDSCPDPAAVFRDCTPLPIAVNLHYFTTDACARDSVGVERGVRSFTEAQSSAEALVRNVNTFFYEMSDNPPMNNPAHGAVDHEPQCVPLRVVLAGLYVHCDSRYQATLPSASRLKPYLVNPDTEINYFLGNIKSSDGYASGLGGTLGAQRNYSPASMAHELLHMLGAPHVFYEDGCDDTWGEINWTWDKDGDGEVDARGRRCWDQWPTPRGPDGELAEADYCAPGNYATPHPCCDEANQNSNLMTYSTYSDDWHKSTLSPCQVEKAVRHALTKKCAYVYGIGGRAAPRGYVFEVGDGTEVGDGNGEAGR